VPSLANSDGEEEDVAMLSKSLSHVEGHQRWASQATPGHGHGVEWISSGEAAAKRTVIVEVGFSLSIQFHGSQSFFSASKV
jgi:hypothetical protein